MAQDSEASGVRGSTYPGIGILNVGFRTLGRIRISYPIVTVCSSQVLRFSGPPSLGAGYTEKQTSSLSSMVFYLGNLITKKCSSY